MLHKKSNNKLIENHLGKNNIKILTKIICFTEFVFLESHNAKAELPQEGILFRTQFPSLVIFINKKVGFLKN